MTTMPYKERKFKAQFGSGAIDAASAKLVGESWSAYRNRLSNARARAKGWPSATVAISEMNRGVFADWPQCPEGFVARGPGRPKKETANE